MQWQVFWQVSKNGNSALQPCHFGKYLLTVGGDEQQETAISPSILNSFVAHFLECIPYMYMHSSMMLECKKWEYIPSECKMSCSLFPIKHIGRYLQCQNVNSMYQSCHK